MNIPQAPAGVYVLRSQEFEAWVLPYGARLMQLWWLQAPEGVRPLSLGFANPQDYRQDTMSIGATCGRYAGRIANGQLHNAGQTYQLDVNNQKGHCIHGGKEGFGEVDWQVVAHSDSRITLQLHSASGHMGFPAHALATVVYSFEKTTLRWQADVKVDAPTPLNLMQHSYWNLDGKPDVFAHTLQVFANMYHPSDAQELPLLQTPVVGSIFDFRVPTQIHPRVVPNMDGTYVLQNFVGANGLRHAATLAVADLSLAVYTNKPHMVAYASAFLRPSMQPLGVAHQAGSALCLETGDLPNGPALGADVWYHNNKPYQQTMLLEFTKL